MFQYLALTDGTTTVELTDGVNYALVSYAPVIAPLRDNALSNSPYSDVTEQITFHAIGCTAADAYAAAAAVTALLEQARRWWLGQAVSAVRLVVQAQNSALSPLAVASKGRAVGGPSNLALPAVFNENYGKYVIQNIQITFVRRGDLIGATQTVTSGSSGHATVLSCPFATNHPISSPVSLTWLGFGSTTTPIISAGYICVGSQASDIQVVEAEGGASGAYTSFGDAGNKARGNNVLRYTPAGVTAVTSGNITIPTTLNGLVGIIAVVRNNSGTTTWQVKANIAGFGYTASTPALVIDASSVLPRMVFLGSLMAVNGAVVNVTVQASAVSGSLDIDYLILVNLRDETVAVIAHDAVDLLTAFGGGATIEMDVIFDPGSNQQPIMRAQNAAGSLLTPMTYRGALPFQSIGATLYALWASTLGASWQFTNNVGTVLPVTPKATRRLAYVVPQ